MRRTWPIYCRGTGKLAFAAFRASRCFFLFSICSAFLFLIFMGGRSFCEINGTEFFQNRNGAIFAPEVILFIVLLLAGLKIAQGEERGRAILIFFHKPNLMAPEERRAKEVSIVRVEDQLATSCHLESCRNLEIALHSRTLTQAIS